MSNPPYRIRWLLTVAAVLGVLGAVAALLMADHSRNLAGLRVLRREAAEFREQLEARNATISALQADVQQLGGEAPMGNKPQTVSALPAEHELARRIAELTLQQSNIAVLVERLLSRTAEVLSPAEAAQGREAAQRREAAITALEESAHEEQQRLEAARQRAAELLVSLGIPEEVSTMDAGKALDTASLRAYWPYFEAKRERDSLQFVADRLRLRLMQERVDARIEGAK